MIEQGEDHSDLQRRSTLFENKYRRGVVLSLWEEGTAVDLTAVSFRETEHQIHQELIEEHLPVLEEMGYIEWDRESGEISKGPNFEKAVEQINRINHCESHRQLSQN